MKALFEKAQEARKTLEGFEDQKVAFVSEAYGAYTTEAAEMDSELNPIGRPDEAKLDFLIVAVTELVKLIEFSDQRPELNPMFHLAELATIDNAKFVELFEALLPKYRWRKNSNIYKLYLASKEGKVKEIKKEVFFEDANLTAYTEGDRAFIHFTMKPARQLIVALKSRKWWWNSGKSAWSTYLDRLDREWVAGISTQHVFFAEYPASSKIT